MCSVVILVQFKNLHADRVCMRVRVFKSLDVLSVYNDHSNDCEQQHLY